MTVELASLLLIGAITGIGWWLSYSQEPGKSRRRWQLLSLILTLTCGLLAIEVYQRKANAVFIQQESERAWISALDTGIAAFEVEVLAPQGLVSPKLLELASSGSFSVDGIALTPVTKSQNGSELQFGALLSREGLRGEARIGHLTMNVVSREIDGAKIIERINSIDCVSSKTNALRIAASSNFDEATAEICSAAVRVKPVANDLKLSRFALAKNVAFTVSLPDKITCIGNCEVPVLFSVKAILHYGDPIMPTMIELSPQVLRKSPSTSSNNGRTLKYTLAGSRLLELAKSYFVQSYGNKQRERFAFTKGVVASVIQLLTSETVTRKVVDIVWTTSQQPSQKAILDAVPVDARTEAEVLRGPEWCGFADLVSKSRDDEGEQLCWHRFVVVAPTPP